MGSGGGGILHGGLFAREKVRKMLSGPAAGCTRRIWGQTSERAFEVWRAVGPGYALDKSGRQLDPGIRMGGQRDSGGGWAQGLRFGGASWLAGCWG